MDMGIRRILMMHAAMMCMSGFPMLSSGDEIGQLNCYDYHEDPSRREDSRNLHRSKFDWDKAALRNVPGSLQQRIWDGLRQLEKLRAQQPCFKSDAWVSTWDTACDQVLALVRKTGDETLVCLFNFSGESRRVHLLSMEGNFVDLITGETGACNDRDMQPYQYCLCLRKG